MSMHYLHNNDHALCLSPLWLFHDLLWRERAKMIAASLASGFGFRRSRSGLLNRHLPACGSLIIAVVILMRSTT